MRLSAQSFEYPDARGGQVVYLRTREPMPQPSDEALMERVCTGDRDAFAQLVDRHLRRAVRVAQGVLGVPAEADEVAQEVFVKLWERPAMFDAHKARFTTWLHRVVVNLSIDRRRGRRTEPLEAALHEAAEEAPALEVVHAEQRAHAVRQALGGLSERQRAALTLFYMEGLPQREAATCMDLSDSAFESLLHRARAALAAAVGFLRPRGDR